MLLLDSIGVYFTVLCKWWWWVLKKWVKMYCYEILNYRLFSGRNSDIQFLISRELGNKMVEKKSNERTRKTWIGIDFLFVSILEPGDVIWPGHGTIFYVLVDVGYDLSYFNDIGTKTMNKKPLKMNVEVLKTMTVCGSMVSWNQWMVCPDWKNVGFIAHITRNRNRAKQWFLYILP